MAARAATPHVVLKIRTAEGKVLYARPADRLGQVIDTRAVGMMNSMMQETLLSGTARKAELPGWMAAGKTGTSQDFRDAWFIGYTANLVTGVWLGNDDNSPTRKATGGGLPGGSVDPLHEGRASGGAGGEPAAFARRRRLPLRLPAVGLATRHAGSHGAIARSARADSVGRRLSAGADTSIRTACVIYASGTGSRAGRLAGGPLVRTVGDGVCPGCRAARRASTRNHS